MSFKKFSEIKFKNKRISFTGNELRLLMQKYNIDSLLINSKAIKKQVIITDLERKQENNQCILTTDEAAIINETMIVFDGKLISGGNNAQI